jgi:hypothetical protein
MNYCACRVVCWFSFLGLYMDKWHDLSNIFFRLSCAFAVRKLCATHTAFSLILILILRILKFEVLRLHSNFFHPKFREFLRFPLNRNFRRDFVCFFLQNPKFRSLKITHKIQARSFGCWFRIQSVKNLTLISDSLVEFESFVLHWKNETVESTHWRRKIDGFWQARSFYAKHCRFYSFCHRFYAFLLFCPKKSQMVRLEFEPTTLGSDFSINIASVLAFSATRLHIFVEVKY